MNKKIIWMVVSGLMALSLVIAACGPAEEEGEEVVEEEVVGGADMVKVTLTKNDGTIIEKMMERPRHGGTLTRAVSNDSEDFDPAYSRSPGEQHPLGLNVLLDGNISMGPGGTGETSWQWGNFMGYMKFMEPSLAESFEIIDDETIVFKIRQGVHFALNPDSEASRLVNGREMTAEDVAFSFERQWSIPSSYHLRNNPTMIMQSATALDRYTLEMKILPNQHGMQLLQTAGRLPIVAPEVIEKYGDMKDWRNVVGTGPFMLTEYIPDSMRVYTRNPNYFQMDPWFPENRLPYVDSVTKLTIPDASTRLAAMRTGRLDELDNITWEDAALFKTDYPDIVQKRRLTWGKSSPTGRLDRPEQPWGPQNDENALKVRRAMNMAVNKQAIVDFYYGGNAELFSDPFPDIPEYEGIYRPLNTYSKEVQELYEYNPEKAKQLLAEAGYPDGFQATMTLTAGNVDLMSIVKDDWSKVGIELILDVKETGAYNSIVANKSFPELVTGWDGIAGMPWKGHQLRPESSWTYSNFSDPAATAAYEEMQLVLGRDDERLGEIYAGVPEIFLESVQQVWMPRAYFVDTWWPWLKRYEGMRDIGVYNPQEGYNHWVWIDQDLKKEMGY